MRKSAWDLKAPDHEPVPVFPAEGYFMLKWSGLSVHMLTLHDHHELSFAPETFAFDSVSVR
jgi:hypothetical protein